jgi:hypothetical protein
MWIAKHFLRIWVDSGQMAAHSDTRGVWSSRRHEDHERHDGPATIEAACERWPQPTAVGEQAGAVVHAVFRLSRLNRMMIGGALRELGLAPGQELLLMQLWDRDDCSQTDLVDRKSVV